MYGIDDTIAAISTPIGEGGIGIVRLSGRGAKSIAEALFHPPVGQARLRSHRLHYGHIIDPETGVVVDEVLVAYMEAPRSYTREDVVEINGHGGPVALQKMLALCLKHGARQALPGEFTLRAFLNGRIDLSQAEAVLDIVQAKTEAALRVSVGQLEGSLSREIKAVRGALMEGLAYLTASIDFTEQEIPPRDIAPTLASVKETLCRLLADADRGIILRQGVRVTIVGRPNVGKSSLLNALLRMNRAIVTPIPGTTRDTLEETVNLQGVPVILVDTAGLNGRSEDPIERLGIERSYDALQRADLILWVIDTSEPLRDDDHAIGRLLSNRPVVVALNKSDLKPQVDVTNLLPSVPRVLVSALTGEGLQELEDALTDMILGGKVTTAEPPLVSSARHRLALQAALQHVESAEEAYKAGMPADFVTIDLVSACNALGEITGETVGEDLLEAVFSRFCIGK